MKIIQESEFRTAMYNALDNFKKSNVKYVTGPGRSGAIAAVYASHYLTIPFIPSTFKTSFFNKNEVLVVDTAMLTGATVRKCMKKFNTSFSVVPFIEPPLVKFWYELY